MNKKLLYALGMAILLAAAVLTFQSCTKDFEEINTDPYAAADNQLPVGEEFKQVLENIYSYSPAWVTQLQQNLIGDVFSGYMMPPTPFRGNSNNMTYFLVDGWNGTPWDWAYANVMAPLRKVDSRSAGRFPAFLAWSKILRVEGMHRISDIYGPVIYSQYGTINEQGGVGYDCQEDAYNLFFQDLDAAIADLTPLAQSQVPGEESLFTPFDLVYGGDLTKWVQFANSLRLRLAIRISKVDPGLAKTQAEAALSHPLGVITSNDANFLVASANGTTHPLNVMDNAWNDIRMGAPMESILTGYSDPRLPEYFEPSVIVPGQYKGIRLGIAIAAKADYEGFSALVDLDKVQLMTAAEVFFLRAEGALRNWNMGGTALDLYEQGIQMSFDQYGLGSAAAYISNGTALPAPYVDPVNPANNTGGAGSVTVQWDEAAGMEVKLEKIITQKWIAMYPDGQEAWSEYRRTGYPRLYPVLVNNSGGTIDSQAGVKRINLPTGEYNTNKTEALKAVTCLGGPDNGGTSLWWDVD
jgi:hypothetical protein